jgi:predicted CoA-binding protein
MRHLSAEKARAWRLLDRARTIAVLGALTAPRRRTTVAYLRRVGYDVRLASASRVSDVGGPIDLVLVFETPADVSQLIQDAAAKRADGVWFTGAGLDRAARTLAGQLALVVVNDADIVRRHQERLREAGQPLKLGMDARRRGRPKKASGGGRAIDEKKMIRARPVRRGRTAGRRAA